MPPPESPPQLPPQLTSDASAAALGTRAVFVYYRIRPARVPALLQAFAGGIPQASSWRAQLMRRVEASGAGGATPAEDGAVGASPEKDALQTWMEVYWLPEGAPPDPAALQTEIERCARAAGIVDLIDGERHYEVFEPCA